MEGEMVFRIEHCAKGEKELMDRGSIVVTEVGGGWVEVEKGMRV